MPRPPRRTRAVSTRTTGVATVSKGSNEPTVDTADKATAATSENSNDGRRRSRRSGAVSETPSAASSDAYGVSDRELKRRTSLRQTATTTSARLAEKTAAAAPRQTRGPDASGLDMDDTFADIDTNFGGHDLGDLDDDLDAFDGLGGLDSSPAVAGETTVAGSANATHTADSTSSSFNVGLFRRGRPRQSSIHSRDDAPIRPSSRGGTATPSFGSTLNLGTFKRRAREPSILGRRRDTSRHTSRDRDAESGSEMDAAPYTSDAESSSMVARRRAGRASRASLASRVSQVAHTAQNVADSSMSSASNTTSMMVMSRTRTRAAAKRKSEEGQREDDLPKRRAVEEVAAPSPLPPSDTGVMQSVEMASSPPLSSPPRSQASIAMSDADRRRYITPGGPDDEFMAPPLSSGSSSASPTVWPTLKGLANAGRQGRVNHADVVPMVPLSRQTPELMDDDDASDISSPPSLTHSPNYRAAAPKAKGKATSTRNAVPTNKNVAPLTTAALAALLPQRHRRGRRGGNDDADVSDGDDGDNELERSALLSEDDDELAHGPRRGGLRRGRSAARTPAAAPAPAALRSASKAAAGNAGNRDSATKASSGKSKRSVRRTYGSRSFSDKENQDSTTVDLDADESTFSPLPDDAFGDETTTEVLPTTARKTRYFGEELENAAKKFKEVDRWTLEFESVSRESSPIGAR